AGALIGIGGARRREAEFLLQLPFHGNDRRDIDAERQLEMQSRRNVLEILAEPLHDSDGVARHRVVRRPSADDDESEDGKNADAARAAARQDLSQPTLSLPDQMLKIGAALGPARPGPTPTAVAVLRGHLRNPLS